MDINKEEIKKTLLEKTEGIRKVLDSKPAVKGLLGKKLLVALVGVVLVTGIAVGCNGKSSSKSEDSSKSKTAKVKMLSPKKVPAYLEVKDYSDGTWIVGYNASIIPENLTIPDGIVGILGGYPGYGVFGGCELLESVKIPGSVKEIGSRAFKDCTSLASVTLAKGLEEIGSGAFEGCTALKSITIPEGVVKIGEEAFSGCTSLRSITIPEGGAEIYNAFKNCTALESVTIAKDVSKIGGGTFKGCTSLKEVHYKNTVKRFKLIATFDSQLFYGPSFEKGVVIHCTDGDYVFGSDAE